MDRFKDMQNMIAQEGVGVGVAAIAVGAGLLLRHAIKEEGKIQDAVDRLIAGDDISKKDSKRLSKYTVAGGDIEEYLKKVRAYKAKYKPIVEELQEKYTKKIEDEITQLRKDKRFKDCPQVAHMTETYFDANTHMFPSHMGSAFNTVSVCVTLEMRVIGDELKNGVDEEMTREEQAAYFGGDTGKILMMSADIANEYLNKTNAIIKKNANALAGELKRVGLPVTGVSFEQDSDSEYSLVEIKLTPFTPRNYSQFNI